MSLVLYDHSEYSNDSNNTQELIRTQTTDVSEATSQNNSSLQRKRSIVTEDGYRVILDNLEHGIVVLQNRISQEVELMDREWFTKTYGGYLTNETSVRPDGINALELRDPSFGKDHAINCPHCGNAFTISETREAVDGTVTQDGSDAGSGEIINSSFIHQNYFKLLESSTLGSKLPKSVFSQGYYHDFFKEIKLLGRGSRGSVYLVEHILNNYELGQFALKKITVGDDPQWLINVLNEVHMLVNISVNNVNLVNYNHVWLEVDSINDFGPRVPCAFILQQYCSGGNLEDFISWLKQPDLTVKEMKNYKIRKVKGRLLSELEILTMFKDIVNGVYELHKNHIIHRDLKPSNCLLSKEYKFTNFPYDLSPDLGRVPTILIGDFGESQLEGEKRNASGNTGTLEYCAPELFELKEFSKKTDIYSLGMILYHMCYGELPFNSGGFNIEGLRKEIDGFEDIFEASAKRKDLNPEIYKLIKNTTLKNPKLRLSAGEILQKIEELKLELLRPPRRPSITNSTNSITLSSSNIKHYIVQAIQLLVLSMVVQKDLLLYLKYLLLFAHGVFFNGGIGIRVALIVLTILIITFV